MLNELCLRETSHFLLRVIFRALLSQIQKGHNHEQPGCGPSSSWTEETLQTVPHINVKAATKVI